MWLVIGYGSLLRSDDRIGRDIVEQVLERAGTRAVEVISANQLTPELSEPISRADGVIFVDASAELAPGTVKYDRLAASGRVDSMPVFVHHCTPEMLLGSARLLFGHQPRAWLCTVGAESLAIGESLSPSVAGAVPQVVDWILNRLPDR